MVDDSKNCNWTTYTLDLDLWTEPHIIKFLLVFDPGDLGLFLVWGTLLCY